MYSAPPIPDPAPGDGVTAAWARAIVRALRSMRLSGGPGVKVSCTPSGTTVSAPPRGGARLSGAVVATVPRIQSSPVSAGGVRVVPVDLAGGEYAEGPFTVVAFPVSRLVSGV